MEESSLTQQSESMDKKTHRGCKRESSSSSSHHELERRKKKRKRSRSSSSSSSTSTSSSSSSSTSSSSSSSSHSKSRNDDERKKKLKKHSKKLRKKEKRKKKKEKKKQKKLLKREKKLKKLTKKLKKKNREMKLLFEDRSVGREGNDPVGEAAVKQTEEDDSLSKDVLEASKARAPMTKEEWEKQQSIIRRVYDPETGRHRLVKGKGEILEECVSRERHQAINRAATKGDGEFFQSTLMSKAKNN